MNVEKSRERTRPGKVEQQEVKDLDSKEDKLLKETFPHLYLGVGDLRSTFKVLELSLSGVSTKPILKLTECHRGAC